MDIDRSDKKSKWTVMKYVRNFDLLVRYAALIRDLKANVSECAIIEVNDIMKNLGVYIPRHGRPSVDTTNFKICQIVYSMFAYRNEDSANKEIVYSPLGNLLLDNLDKKEWVAKIYATMMYGMPFSHPFNRMRPDFDIYPMRLIFRLLTDSRLEGKLYEDEMFYYLFWVKDIDKAGYETLVRMLVEYRSLSLTEKYKMCKERLSVEDALANALHETHYLFGQLESAGIVSRTADGVVGSLRQGGFGRGIVPDFLTPEELEKHKPTGIRAYRIEYIRLNPYMLPLITSLLAAYPFDEKPHRRLDILGRQDYILHLYNFYPSELLDDLGIRNQNQVQTMLQIAKNIKWYSRNQNAGDCYRFEDALTDAFNEFVDVDAHKLGGSGNTDVECLYLTIDEKFAVEAKSTRTKLGGINAGRLQLHRKKINAGYTIIVAPYYTSSVETDICGTDNVLITASSLSNFLYQYAIHAKGEMSYKVLYDMVRSSLGKNITSQVNSYVSTHFGIGKR